MDPQGLIEELVALPNVSAQKQLLEQHIPLLDDQFATMLKAQADQFLRADLQHSLGMADLLIFMTELTHNPCHRALGLLAEANARSIGRGEYQRAVELYDEAAAIYRSEKRWVEHARSQVGKIASLGNLGRYDEALSVARWANDVLSRHAAWIPQATLLLNMGIMYDKLGDLPHALEVTEQAIEIYSKLGEAGEAGLGLAHMNRGVILRSLGRFDASIQASQLAQAQLTGLGQSVEAARAQQTLALTYFVLGRYNETMAHLDQVRDVFVHDGRQRDAMLVELFISDCLLQMRRFNEVLDKCACVRDLFADLGAHFVVAQAIVNEAVAYAELGRYAEALSSLAEARASFVREGNRVWIAAADLQAAVVMLREDRVEESLAAALNCADACHVYDLPLEEAQARILAARAALFMGRLDLASQLTAQALQVGEQHQIPQLIYQGHHVLGKLALADDRLEDALVAYDHAVEQLERLRGHLMVEFRVGFLEGKEIIHEEAVDLCLAVDQPMRALEYAERAKSRALLDMVTYRLDLGIQTRHEADRPLVDELLQMRTERDRLYRAWENGGAAGLRGYGSDDPDRQQAQQGVLALEKRITELWYRLLVRNADYARDASNWRVRVEPIQPFLSDETLLLEYYVVRQKLVVFLVTQTHVQGIRLPVELAQIQHLTQLLWLNLRAVPRSTVTQVLQLECNARMILQRLYDLLLGPFHDILSEHRRVIVVPHGPLHYIPFQALHDGQAYFLKQHAISYLPGASFLRYCSEALVAERGSFALGHSHGERLPHTLTEARSIATLMGGQVYVEEEATQANLKQHGSDCRIVHLAAHADFRPDNPLFSGIALADGWLTTLDIFNLRLRASLVTLSACQTGRSVVGGGDELLGLMRAFISAGAASLALSLWAVEDRSTALLMETFYQELAGGRRKDDALRHAQLQLANVQDANDDAAPYAHPYFWAPFFLVGDAGLL